MRTAIVLVFIMLDFISGMIKSFKNHNFDSSVMRDGLINKVGELLIIVLALVSEKALPYLDISVGIPIVTGIYTYISLMEIGSIIENVGAINQSIVPEQIRKFFKKIGGDNE